MRLGLLALVLSACPPAGPSPTDSTAAMPLEAWYYGCDDIGEECAFEADQRQLTFWVESVEELAIDVDGTPVESTSRRVDGGLQLKASVAELPAVVTLYAPETGQKWTRRVIAKPHLPTADEVNCDAPAVDGTAAAKAMTRVHCAWATLRTEDEAARAKASERVPQELYEASKALRAAGWETEAVRVQFQASFMAMRSGGGEDALEWALALEPSNEGIRNWGRAQLVAMTGVAVAEYKQAAHSVEEAMRVGIRLDLPKNYRDDTRHLQASVAASLGDLDTAVASYADLVKIDPPPGNCGHSLAINRHNLAWYELLRRRAHRPPRSDVEPRALLELAGAGLVECGDAQNYLPSVLVNLAFEAWSRQAWTETLHALDQVTATADPTLKAWSAALRSRAQLGLGNMDAAFADAERAGQIAVDNQLADVVAFALLTQAEVELARGEPTESLRFVRAAKDHLFDGMPQLPSPTDKSQFIGMRLSVMPRILSLIIALELKQGRPGVALRELREFRIRALNSLRQGAALTSLDAERRGAWQAASERYETLRTELADSTSANWSLSAEELVEAKAQQAQQQTRVDEALAAALQVLSPRSAMPLRPPGPEETLVAWVPVSGSWVGLVADTSGVRVIDGPEDDLEGSELAQALITSLQGHIGDTRRLTFLPFGAVHDLELHSTQWDDARLVDTFDLAWALDMPATPAGPVSGEFLVIGDPDGSLPGARAEAQGIAQSTGATLLLGEAATRDASLSALNKASMLHYAGHGLLDPNEAFRSGLTLADATLDVGDLLSLSSAPSLVVLSGCETGRSRSDHRVATLGIAQALLLSGSQVVVASDKAVADQETTALLSGLLTPGANADAVVRSLNARQRRSQHPENSLAWKAWIR